MKINYLIPAVTFFSSFLLTSNSTLMAQEGNDNVAKIIIIKGLAKAQLSNQKIIDLKKDDWLPEGATIQTTDKSFVKLVFIDKSTVSVGPSSQMVITAFPKEGAGVLSVIKGQIRSQVVKELESNEESKTKLFVKTKSAAMGVRGTDFEVLYNSENNVTSLITFEGSVAFAKMDNNLSANIDNNIKANSNDNHSFEASGNSIISETVIAQTTTALESIISSDKAVSVGAGEFSGANPNAPMATIPTKISPAQFETMKANMNLAPPETSSNNTKNEAQTAPKYISVVAPGLPASLAANTESSISKVVASNLGGEENLKKAVAAISGESKKNVEVAKGTNREISSSEKTSKKEEVIKNSVSIPTEKNKAPEGFLNKETGEYKPPAGGYVDFGTGLYIPPPPGSTFDANTGVFIPPPQFGGFNAVTGNYAPPAGLTLTSSGEFKTVQQERAPAGGVTIAEKTNFIPPPINASGDLARAYNPTLFNNYVAPASIVGNQYSQAVAFANENTKAGSNSQEPAYIPPTYDSEKLDNLRSQVYNQINNQTQAIQNSRVRIIIKMP